MLVLNKENELLLCLRTNKMLVWGYLICVNLVSIYNMIFMCFIQHKC